MPMLRQPIGKITPSDLDSICSEQWQEDEQLDFKEMVPHKEGEGADPWKTSRTVKPHGRDQLLSTVVAFANSYGGDLLIGVREDGGKPGKAIELAPIDECEDLAHRLAQMANASIDPPLPNLQVRGIVTNSDGSGVVLLRTARSRLAPHRLNTNKESYQRVRDITLELGMRQIQDLTLSANRGLAEIDSRFDEIRGRFSAMAAVDDALSNPTAPKPLRRYALRVTCVPLGQCYLEKVHGVQEVQPRHMHTNVVVKRGTAPIEIFTPFQTYDWRPILRGSEAREARSGNTPRDKQAVTTVYCDGTINYGLVIQTTTTDEEARQTEQGHPPFYVYPGWLFGMILNAVDCADRFRSFAGASALEYALEFEVETSHRLVVMEAGRNPFHDAAGVFERGAHAFPRYSLGPRETWSQSLGLMWRDFFNSIGVPVADSTFEIAG